MGIAFSVKNLPRPSYEHCSFSYFAPALFSNSWLQRLCTLYLYTDPLSNYPSAKLLSKLQVDRWRELGAHLRLTEYQLENAKKSSQPTMAVLLAAKVRDINLKWNQIVESLLRVGEYELAKGICNKHGKLAFWCVCIQTGTSISDVEK